MQRRNSKRVRQRIPCEFLREDLIQRGIVTDLSSTGLFVQTRAVLLPGETVTVLLRPADSPPVEVRARVVRKSLSATLTSLLRRSGVALELTETSEGFPFASEDPEPTKDLEHSEWHPDDVVIEVAAPASGDTTESREPESPAEDDSAHSAQPEASTGDDATFSAEPDAADGDSALSGEPEAPTGDETASSAEPDPSAHGDRAPSREPEAPTADDNAFSAKPNPSADGDRAPFDQPEASTGADSTFSADADAPVESEIPLEPEAPTGDDASCLDPVEPPAPSVVAQDTAIQAPPDIESEPEPADATPPSIAPDPPPTTTAERQPAVIDALIVDDGELDDVRDLLRELGARTARRQLSDSRGPQETWERAPSLLVVAARSALRLAVTAKASASGTLAIAVVDNLSQTLREQLRRQGYHYTVQRPVHVDAMRALLAAALYTGPQRRRLARVPIGAPVSLSGGLRRRSATLLDLSSGGCRLLADRWAAPGRSLQLVIPRLLTGHRELRVRGRVLRVARRPGAPAAEQVTLVLAFDELSPQAAECIDGLLQEHSTGPFRIQRDAAARADSNRREDPRFRIASWGICQLERDPAASRVVFGRDISMGGMNIGAEPDLIEGDRLRLELRDDTSGEPLLLEAVVARDDGPRGVALRFIDPRAYLDARLAPLLRSRPVLGDLKSSEEEARSVIIERAGDNRAA